MSFRCEACKIPQPAGSRPTTKVVAFRSKTYLTMGGDIPGTEIIKEQRLCSACATTLIAVTIDGQRPTFAPEPDYAADATPVD